MRQYKLHCAQPLYGKVIFWPLFLLAVAPLVLTTPAHATNDNDNHVEITVADTTQFERQGQLFKATANVTVKTVKPYGFNLTLQASNSDLTNTSDPTTKIASTPATTPMALNSDQWGYSLNSKATTFSRVPNLTQPAAVLADVTKAKPAGCQDVKQCTKHVTYAANVDIRLLTPGEYSTEVVYTATAKPKPAFVNWGTSAQLKLTHLRCAARATTIAHAWLTLIRI